MTAADEPTLPAVEADSPRGGETVLRRGDSLGRYVILSKLGAGGMGIVYAAYDPELDRKVAVKLLLSSGTTEQERLTREAQAMAKLQHPNVVAVHDVGAHQNQVFVAMEFVAGKTLREWANENRPSWRRVVDVFARAGRGLAAAHARGLVHRDFKPDNAMIDSEGRVRVMGFGLARASVLSDANFYEAVHEDVRSTLPGPQRAGAALTRDGAAVGTPAYMAPEQLDGTGAGPASDQVSFCVSLWELLFAERPFQGESLVDLAGAILAGRVTARPPGIRCPAWLELHLRRGLAPEPGQRWPSMAELIAALTTGERRQRRRRALAGGAGAVALAVLASGGWAWRTHFLQATCEASALAINTHWDGGDSELRDAFAKTGASNAGDVATAVTPLLDDWASKWRETSEAACIAAVVVGNTTEAQRLRTESCLENRAGQLDQMLDLLKSESDTRVVQRAVQIAAALDSPTRCGDDDWTRAHPSEYESSSDGQELRAALWQATLLHEAGRYDEALAVAGVALEESDLVGSTALRTEARIVFGRVAARTGNRGESIGQLQAGFDEAMAARDNERALRAANGLVIAMTPKPDLHKEADVWLRVADGLAAALAPNDDLLVAEALTSAGNLHNVRGRYAEAEAAHKEALRIRRLVLGPDHPHVAASMDNLGMVYERLGRYADGQQIQEQAYDLYLSWCSSG